MFSCEFCEIFKNTFFTEHLRTTASEKTEADSGLVKLVVTTNAFFNNQQQGIKIERFICVKQTKSSFFSNSWKESFHS